MLTASPLTVSEQFNSLLGEWCPMVCHRKMMIRHDVRYDDPPRRLVWEWREVCALPIDAFGLGLHDEEDFAKIISHVEDGVFAPVAIPLGQCLC